MRGAGGKDAGGAGAGGGGAGAPGGAGGLRGGGAPGDWDALAPGFLGYSAARNTQKHVVATAKALERWRGFLEGRGVCELRDIVGADVAAFAVWRRAQTWRGRPVGVPSANRDLAALKALFTWAVRTEQLEHDPCARIHLARESTGTKTVTIVELQDFEKVAALLGEHWRDAAVAMLGTGMRWGSLAALVPGTDLDAARRVVVLRRPKGKKAIELQTSDRCFAALQRVAGSLSSEPSGFDKAVRLACKEASVPRWTAHHLRHTFAVACIRAGADIRSVQQWMGHASIKTTEIYLRFAQPKAPPAPV